MSKIHSHQFVEEYDGLVGFGLNREVDECTLTYYLQKFSDDDLMALIRPRLSESDLEALFDMVSRMLKKHLKEDEYHQYFLFHLMVNQNKAMDPECFGFLVRLRNIPDHHLSLLKNEDVYQLDFPAIQNNFPGNPTMSLLQ